MNEALRKDDLHEFVRSFIEERVVNCDEYLTDENLTTLYNQASPLDRQPLFNLLAWIEKCM